MNSLQSLKIQIMNIEASIAAEKEKEWSVLTNLGQAVYDSEARKTLPEELIHPVDMATNKINTLEDSLRQLLETEELSTTLSEEKQSLNVELRNLRNKTQSSLEEFAKSAWEYWKTAQEPEELGEALKEIIKADDRIRAVDDATSRNAQLNGNWGGSILSRGRALFLSGRRRTASTVMERLWGVVGRGIYENVDGQIFSNTSVETSAEALKAIEVRKLEIQDSLLQLAAKNEDREAKLERLPGKGSLRNRINIIEKMLKDDRSSLNEAFNNLGAAWLNTDVDDEFIELGGNYKKDWDEIRDTIKNLEETKNSLDVHCRYQEAETAWSKQVVRVENIDARLKKLQVQLKTARKELTALDKKRTKLKESLIPLPDSQGSD